MTFEALISQTRSYARDTNSYMFALTDIKNYINQAIDRVRQYAVFSGMSHLSADTDVPSHIPEQYHYILALFAASRCFEYDERFYESVERRNEFESAFESLIADVQAGNVLVVDGDGDNVTDSTICTDVVRDVYFNVSEEEFYNNPSGIDGGNPANRT